MRRLVLCAGMLAGLAGCNQTGPTQIDLNAFRQPFEGGVHTVRSDHGGVILSYAMRVNRYRESGTPVRFDGRCDSACTLYLSLPRSQTCIAPGASFGFHLPFGSSSEGDREAAKYLLRQYPSWVRSWIRSKGGLSRTLKRMSYSHARRFLPRCKNKSPADWY